MKAGSPALFLRLALDSVQGEAPRLRRGIAQLLPQLPGVDVTVSEERPDQCHLAEHRHLTGAQKFLALFGDERIDGLLHARQAEEERAVAIGAVNLVRVLQKRRDPHNLSVACTSSPAGADHAVLGEGLECGVRYAA